MSCMRDNKSLQKYEYSMDSWADGFTLIEVIIGLTMLSIVASMMLSFTGNTFLNTVTPVVMLSEHFGDDANNPGITEVMEEIISDYFILIDKSEFVVSASEHPNYDSTLSKIDYSTPDISNTGTKIKFDKVVIRRNNQKIIALFPKY